MVGSAGNGLDAINLAGRLDPSVVVMDIDLGSDPNGIEAGKIIKAQRPYPGIVFLTQHKDRQYVANLSLGEASGWSYLLKHNVDHTEALVRAIRGAAWGLMTVDREVLEQLVPREGTVVEKLGAGQRLVLELVAQGYTDDAIGRELGVSEETAQHEVRDLFHGLGLEGHEPPYLVEGNDQLLEPGMTFTIEPGIYIPGELGIRIEDVCHITSDGAEWLSSLDPSMDTVAR